MICQPCQVDDHSGCEGDVRLLAVALPDSAEGEDRTMSDATARLPWRRGGRQTSYIYDADGKVVAESAGLEFVALIVHRVNAHVALVEALEAARKLLDELDGELLNENSGSHFLAEHVLPVHADKLREILRAALGAVGSRNGEAKR